MEYSYDELIQDFYCQYQKGYTFYLKFKNCFNDYSEYQDLVSTVYMRFHENLEIRRKYISGQISGLGLRSEFGTAIKHASVDAWRSHKRWITEPIDNFNEYYSFGEEESGEDILMAKEELKFIHEKYFMQARLTEQEVAIFLDYFFIGAKQHEIARRHAITERTVRNKLSSAQRKLRKVTGKS